MPRKFFSRQESTCNPITYPNSFTGILSLENKKPLPQRKKNSYYNLHLQTKQVFATKPGRKQIAHRNKLVTYLKEEGAEETQENVIYSANQQKLRTRKKNEFKNIHQTTLANVSQAYDKLFSASCDGFVQYGQMNRRKKYECFSISKETNPPADELCDNNNQQRIYKRGNRKYKGANSRQTVKQSGKKTIGDYEHLYLKLTEEKDYKPRIETKRAGFEQTNTLQPTENESITQRYPKVLNHQLTNIVNPESATQRRSSSKALPQSYMKTNIISHSEIIEETPQRTFAVRMSERSHPTSWIF